MEEEKKLDYSEIDQLIVDFLKLNPGKLYFDVYIQPLINISSKVLPFTELGKDNEAWKFQGFLDMMVLKGKDDMERFKKEKEINVLKKNKCL